MTPLTWYPGYFPSIPHLATPLILCVHRCPFWIQWHLLPDRIVHVGLQPYLVAVNMCIGSIQKYTQAACFLLFAFSRAKFCF